MAGGRGARFWPLSQPHCPKQCIPWGDRPSLLVQAIERALKLVGPDDITILTGPAMRLAVIKDVEQAGLSAAHVQIEPSPRNTAPCVALALGILPSEPDSVLIMPADHLIQDESAWLECVQKAHQEQAKRGAPVLFGINPTRPHTGFGYIQSRTVLSANELEGVERFREKPSLELAEYFLSQGNYLWNAGMILAPIGQLELAYERFLPKSYRYIQSVREGAPLDVLWFETEEISLDFGILERMTGLMVIAMDAGWSDLGAWDSAHLVLPPQEYGHGIAPQVAAVNSSECIVMSESMDVALVGVTNIAVVQHGRQLLVLNRDAAQDIRAAVTAIEKAKS